MYDDDVDITGRNQLEGFFGRSGYPDVELKR
jgi:hypothetical protein